MATDIEKVRVECDERGFELHLLDDEGDWHIYNVHSCADQLYDTVKAHVGPWLQERDEAREAFARREFGECSCPTMDSGGDCDYCSALFWGESQPEAGESAMDYYRRTGDDGPLRELADAVKDGRDDRP